MTKRKERFQVQAEFCKAMAHPVRLEILYLLKAREMSVGDLADAVGVPQANLSQHLAVLRARGAVVAVRRGHVVGYSLADPKIGEACSLIHSILSNLADHRQSVVAT